MAIFVNAPQMAAVVKMRSGADIGQRMGRAGRAADQGWAGLCRYWGASARPGPAAQGEPAMTCSSEDKWEVTMSGYVRTNWGLKNYYSLRNIFMLREERKDL